MIASDSSGKVGGGENWTYYVGHNLQTYVRTVVGHDNFTIPEDEKQKLLESFSRLKKRWDYKTRVQFSINIEVQGGTMECALSEQYIEKCWYDGHKEVLEITKAKIKEFAAMRQYRHHTIIVSGGSSQSKRLRDNIELFARDAGIERVLFLANAVTQHQV